MQQTDIILIDTESEAIAAIREICEPLVASVDSAKDEANAIEQLARKHYGIAIVDISICDSSGFKLYDYILKAHKSTRVLLRCRQTDVMEAISATRNGCFAFFQLPSMQVQLPHLVQAAAQIDQRRAVNTWRNLMTHRSALIDTLLDQIGHCAGSDMPVHITGPAGSGKRLSAELIHLASDRAKSNFAVLDCRAKVPEQIIHDLFGYEAGAFPEAKTTEIGILKRTEGGSLLLHHVDTLPHSVQTQIIQLLETGLYRPLGALYNETLKTRIIATADRDLESEMMSGNLTEDLYYQLQAMQIKVPELAEHAEDIPLLIKQRAKQAAKLHDYASGSFSSGAMQLLTEASWPGNVKQLFDFIDECVAAYSEGGAIPAEFVESRLGDAPRAVPTFQEARAAFEREYLIQVLLISEGNVTQAARLADRNRTDFYKLLKRNNLDPSNFKHRPAVVKRSGQRGPLPRPRLKMA
jgi:two-component system response regulator GlrR